MHLSRSADYVVLKGRFLVAEITDREGRSIVANLYRNPQDFVEDRAMERQLPLRVKNPQPYHPGYCSCARQGSCGDAASHSRA